MTKLLTSKVG